MRVWMGLLLLCVGCDRGRDEEVAKLKAQLAAAQAAQKPEPPKIDYAKSMEDPAFRDAFLKGLKKASAASESQKVSVRAAQLLADYKDNEVGGDDKWKGRRVRVIGTVKEVRKDIFGNPVVVLKGPEFLSSVDCRFSEDTTAPVGRIQKAPIVLDGTVTGMVMRSVMLSDCHWPTEGDLKANSPELLKELSKAR